jgi:hypothetical protein
MSKSSIEWYEQRLYDIEFAFTQGVFDNNEYQARKSEALKEAKEMEKEQMIDFAHKCSISYRYEIERKYNETYGGNK